MGNASKNASKNAVLAVLLAMSAGAAVAQSSSVQLYGRLDIGLTRVDPKNASATTGINSGIQSGNRWGLKGSEELGSGVKANFQLESGFALDTGTLGQGGRLFGRQAWVGFSGGFGEIRLGRQYTAYYNVVDTVDPFGTGFGVSDLSNTANSQFRFDNAATYLSPSLGGFQAEANYSFGETNVSISTRSAYSVAASFARGPVYVGLGIEQLDKQVVSGTRDEQRLFAGATGDFKVVMVHAAYSREKLGSGAGTETGFMGGVTVPIGDASVFTSYQQDKINSNKRKTIALGATYGLSKRTNLYAYGANLKLEPVDNGQNEFAVGVRHKF